VLSVLTAIFAAPALGFSPEYAVFSVLAFAVVIMGIDFGIAIVLRLLPFHIFAPPYVLFRPIPNERKFWRKTGIKRWKVVVPDLAKTLKVFDKTTLKHTFDPDYMFKFLCEMGYAETMHVISAFAGFIAVFIPIGWALSGAVDLITGEYILLSLAQAAIFALPLALGNMVMNLLPAFIQRYNRPIVLKLYQRAVRLKEQGKLQKICTCRQDEIKIL